MRTTALTRLLLRAGTRPLGTRARARAAQAQVEVATCLSDLARAAPHGSVVSVEMRGSEDLVCNNLMCEQLGGACVCRLARFMDSLPLVERIDLSQNNLSVLPDAIWDRHKLRELDLSLNALTRLPPHIAALTELEVLRLAGNGIRELPDELFEMPSLRELDVRDNPLAPHERHRLAAVAGQGAGKAAGGGDGDGDGGRDKGGVEAGGDGVGKRGDGLRVLWQGDGSEALL